MIYLILFFIIFASAITEQYSKNYYQIQFSLVFRYTSLFLMFFLAAYRFETGGDWPGYRDIFLNGRAALEPLFYFIVKLARWIGDYQYIFIITMLVRYILLHIFIKKVCLKYFNNYSLFLLLYYCMFYFHDDFISIRQSLAASIFLLVFVLKNMSFVKYLLVVLAATCIHFSSIVLLPLYPLIFSSRTSLIRKVSILVFLFFLLKVDFLRETVNFFYPILPRSYLVDMMNQYVNNSAIGFARKLTGQSYVFIITFCLIILNTRGSRLFLGVPALDNSILMFYILYFGLINYFVISVRLTVFFNLFIIFQYSILIVENYTKKRLFSVLLFVLAFAFNKNIFLMQESAAPYIPYQSYIIYKSFNFHSDGYERLMKNERSWDLIKK